MNMEKEKSVDAAVSKDDKQDLSFLFNVPMRVSVELGRGNLTIKDLLQLGQGSVLELEKLAGEPLEVLVNNRLVSRGEVVVVNDKFGIRLTDVINPEDKLNEST
jgi:flagellar motor switch protein FliN/FliY